ncbi:MAG: FKBP-type peptidyl-prolyl cis-trans isomerase [Kangiellaceae bacterium]|nr:FKBP-type peptidyl-prolyl cis-trans isomerase [Kangiellaceae bacterium]
MSNSYDSFEQKASYGIGMNMGNQLLGQSFDGLEIDAVAHGLKDAFAKVESVVSREDLQAAFDHITKMMQAKATEKSKGAVEAGENHLKANSEKEGVTVTESGLQYEVITAGSGDVPTVNSKVKTHYHGTLIDGTVFDSSYDRGEPAEFPVNGVIAGWTEALQLMPVGSKWKLTIPYALAYGEQGAGGSIGPCETLVFDIELLEITA